MSSKNDEIIFYEGQVLSVADEFHGGRIKVKLKRDIINPKVPLNDPSNDYLNAFPLMPKTFHAMPKVGETVLVFTRGLGNVGSQRYYIGPIISQPQFFEEDKYPNSLNLTQEKDKEYAPKETIDKYSETKGSFPDNKDVSIVGRKSEDITLKDGEIDIRCGIRKKAIDNELVGNVLFNSEDPSYIQLKYNENGLTNDSKGVINIVSDKINLISHKNEKGISDGAKELASNGNLLTEENIKKMLNELHQLPYGDILVEYLERMRGAILNHYHPYPGRPPCQDIDITMTKQIDFNNILSPNVRIS